MPSSSFVYIAANLERQLFVGVTKDPEFAMYLHKRGDMSPRLRKRRIDRLVHLERFDSLAEATARQQTIRRMSRKQRIALIETRNPDWRDLSQVPTPVPAGSSIRPPDPDDESFGAGGGV